MICILSTSRGEEILTTNLPARAIAESEPEKDKEGVVHLIEIEYVFLSSTDVINIRENA